MMNGPQFKIERIWPDEWDGATGGPGTAWQAVLRLPPSGPTGAPILVAAALCLAVLALSWIG